MVITNEYGDFVNFTLDYLIDFVWKVISMAFWMLGRLTCFCNPGNEPFLIYQDNPLITNQDDLAWPTL